VIVERRTRSAPCAHSWIARHRGADEPAAFPPLSFVRLVMLAWCALGLVAVGVSPAAAETSTSGPSRDGLASSIHWERCGVRLGCARVRVPLDWARPGGPKLTIAVIRHLASRPDRRIGSLFVNGGGASGSVELVRSDGARLDALGQGRFDVVGWALRGGAGAEPMVRCFADQRTRERFWDGLSIPTTRAQSLAYLPKTVVYARRCGALSGRLLAHVSTTDDARDLDYLRRLLGDRQLSYWAVSYGTFLGETYANLFPRRVRAMALDGLVDPRIVIRGAVARFSNTVAAMDRGLLAFASVCQRAGSGRCALAGRGAVAPRVAGLVARLRRAPIPAPTASPPGALSYGDLSAVLFASLTNPAAWPQLAPDLEQAANGDGSALATQARAVLAGTRSAAGDPPTAITCTDSPARQGPGAWPQVIARLTRVSHVGGPFVGWSNWAPCASWPARSTDRYTGPWNAHTKNPILVIGTTLDPATPYANARRVAHLLGNATLLTHDGYGHTSEADPSHCVERATSTYLVDLTTPPKGTVCPSDRQPFDPQFGEPPPVEAVP
jgi:pimeloyl-ACP methyl ester carboxylesterase